MRIRPAIRPAIALSAFALIGTSCSLTAENDDAHDTVVFAIVTSCQGGEPGHRLLAGADAGMLWDALGADRPR